MITYNIVGRLAALWPLLGIVLEAVVLCVIIVVHERKRRREKALADTNEEVDNDDSKDATTATNRRLSVPFTTYLHSLYTRIVPNISFVFYSGRLVRQIVYSYSAE